MQSVSLSAVHLRYLLDGAYATVGLSLLAFVGGGAGGLVIALAGISRIKLFRLLARVFVQLIQGTPLLVLMFLSYFGLSALGVKLNPLGAAAASMTIYAASYLGEIWRGCINSVDITQWEAAESLGLSRIQTIWMIIIPQALRIAVPPTVGFMVQIVKNTSIASILGFSDLTYSGKLISNSTFEPFIVYALVCALYFCMCYPLSRLSRSLERSLHVQHS